MLRSDQNNNVFSYTQISPLSATELRHTSMCGVNGKFVYFTGGSDFGVVVANSHRYDIDRNLWQEMQSMHQPRYCHSSCQLAGHIYVFCGRINQNDGINSVEKLSIDADPNLQVSKQWEMIPEANLRALPALSGKFLS